MAWVEVSIASGELELMCLMGAWATRACAMVNPGVFSWFALGGVKVRFSPSEFLVKF